jgi:hypothetical protein
VPNGIDLEAVVCVDLGHHWEQTFLGRATSGKLGGLPVRECVCASCGSVRIDHLTWSGTVVARQYHLEDSYIFNARRLDDDMHERRKAYRTELVKRARKAQSWEDHVREAEEALSA